MLDRCASGAYVYGGIVLGIWGGMRDNADYMRMRLGFRSLGLALLAVAAAGVLLQIGPAQASSKKARRSTASATKQQALAAYGKLPLSFIANAGQADARVRYAAQGAGFSVFLTRREAMLSLKRPGKQGRGRGVALALRFLGSNRNVAIRGERPGPGRVNYLLGNDPAKWRTGLRTYERVVYREPLAGCGHGLRGPERHAQVRVPRPPWSPRRATSGSPTAARSGSRSTGKETCASAPRSASSPTRDR